MTLRTSIEPNCGVAQVSTKYIIPEMQSTQQYRQQNTIKATT